MKRLTSLDFLRGIAIIFMVAVHMLLAVWYIIGHLNLDYLFAHPWTLPFAGIIILITHWRGLFILISSIVTYHRMAEAVKNGKAYQKILINELLYGLIVLIIAKIYTTFFTTWGIFDDWTRGLGWKVEKLDFFYFAEALDIIAFGIIISALLFFLMQKWNSSLGKIAIYFVLGILVFLLSDLVHTWVNTLAIWPDPALAASEGWTLQSSDRFMDEVVRPIRRTILVWLGGREAPIFPMLGVSFIGSCIGIIITQEKPQIKHIRYGYLGALGLFLIGGIVLVIQIFNGTFEFRPDFHIHPTWFILINTAFQGWLVLLLFRFIEYNPKLNEAKWLKISLPVRRWGMIALSIFMFQWWDGVVRWLFIILFDLNLNERYTVNKWWSLALIITSLLMFELIIRLWEKIHFIGTWEFGLRIFRSWISGKPVQVKDALHLQEKLYDVEMIHFTKSKPEQIKKQEISPET